MVIFFQVIKEKIKSKKDKKGLQNQDIVPRKRLAFLDMLIDSVESGDIDIEGLREEVDTFMFEVSRNIIMLSTKHVYIQNLTLSGPGGGGWGAQRPV